MTPEQVAEWLFILFFAGIVVLLWILVIGIIYNIVAGR